MNKKMAARVLKKKHEEFCTSIKDENLKKLVEKNSIITGGSIVSLLLKEKVSDFDYYFTDMATVKAVANYYVKMFIELNPTKSIKPIVVMDGDRVRIQIKSAGITAEGKDESDYQYFEGRSEGEGEEYINEMYERIDDVTLKESDESGEETKPLYRPVFLSDNAITLSNHVQLVIRFYGSADEIHKNYDYVHCTNYWESLTGQLTLRQQALESMLARQLQYTGSLYPLCSIIRMRKFLKRGWHINAGQILKMCFQLSQLDLTNVNVLEDQLTGVDAAYFMEIIDWCKKKQEETPDFKITMPYLITIIDKVFY